MKLDISLERELIISGQGIVLRGMDARLNGAPLMKVQAEVIQGARRVVVRYHAPELAGGVFEVWSEQVDAARIALGCAIDRLPDGLPLDSFGIRWVRVENARAFLRSGYHSWDGSEYVETRVPGTTKGYALTQLLSGGSGSLVLGFERHDRFQHEFLLETQGGQTALAVQTLWDRKTRRAGERCESERLVIIEHGQEEEARREWAQIVGRAAPVPPRNPPRIIGWSSWYNLYAAISEENIFEHLRNAAEAKQRYDLPMCVFQIDDGFTPEMGDWLLVKPQFPRGMKPLLDDIRTAGFIPGLWIAPFMVGNRSRLYREHPDWVVRDRTTGGPLVQMRFYGEFRWHKRSEEYYILDTTHPDAFEYLRHVFRTWRREWGCEYFKTDFMFFGCAHGPDRIVRQTPGLTRIEIWRRTAEMIREEIGDALWLGCGCPLWAGIGLVDAVRTGRDVGVEWGGDRPARALLRDLALRNFANGIVWQSDPDTVLLRERFHYLSDIQVQSLALFATLCGGVLMTSDDLGEMGPERLRFWKFLLNPNGASSAFPLPDWLVQGIMVQVAKGTPANAVCVFNTEDMPQEFRLPLKALGLDAPAYILNWTGSQEWEGPTGELQVQVPAHAAVLLFHSGAPGPVPQALPSRASSP